MFVNESGRNEQSVYMTFQGCSMPSFDSKQIQRGRFKKKINQSETRMACGGNV
jgi:hypothetical protein